jgi:hypothetical protein
MLRKALIFFVMVIALAVSVQALGLSNLNFGDVEQGFKSTQTLTLITSPQDFDNHFVIEVGGEMQNWISVSPGEFDLPKDTSKDLTVTLAVPKDAPLGAKTATITAVGKNTAPSSGGTPGGATVGYAVAAKSVVLANVLKPGATAAIEITRVDTPQAIKPGDDVKFTISARNAGNIPATGQFSVAIFRDKTAIATIPGAPVEFALNAEQIVKLYWDTGGQPEGTYTAIVSVTPSSSGKDVKVQKTSYPPITLQLGGIVQETPASPQPENNLLIIIGGVCLVIVIGLVFFVLKKRRSP